jgi:hypothetical protein
MQVLQRYPYQFLNRQPLVSSGCLPLFAQQSAIGWHSSMVRVRLYGQDGGRS